MPVFPKESSILREMYFKIEKNMNYSVNIFFFILGLHPEMNYFSTLVVPPAGYFVDKFNNIVIVYFKYDEPVFLCFQCLSTVVIVFRMKYNTVRGFILNCIILIFPVMRPHSVQKIKIISY